MGAQRHFAATNVDSQGDRQEMYFPKCLKELVPMVVALEDITDWACRGDNSPFCTHNGRNAKLCQMMQ